MYPNYSFSFLCFPFPSLLLPPCHACPRRVSFSTINSQKWIYIANASKLTARVCVRVCVCVWRVGGEKQSINVAQRILLLHTKAKRGKWGEKEEEKGNEATGNWQLELGTHSEQKLTKRKVCQAATIWNGEQCFPSHPLLFPFPLLMLAAIRPQFPFQPLSVCLVVFFIKYS